MEQRQRERMGIDKPHVMVGVPFVAASSDERAQHLSTTMIQRSLGILRGQRAALKPPVEDMEAVWNPGEKWAVAERMAMMVAGGPDLVRKGLEEILRITQADELILVSDAYERADRLKSFEMIAESKRRAVAAQA